MRVLNFLIVADYNLLIEKIVDYLVDGGHQAVVMANKDDYHLWQRSYAHNFTLLQPGDKLPAIDYIINFSSSSETFGFTELKFSAELSKDRELLTFAIYLAKENTKSELASCQLALGEFVQSKTSFNDDLNNLPFNIISWLYSELTELFIDAVILLQRISDYQANNNLASHCANSFIELLNYEQKLNKLKAFYLQNEQDLELFFKLENQLTNSYKLEHTSYSNCVLNEIYLSSEDLQLLLVFCLNLLNAREGGIYTYTYIENNLSITKLIQTSKIIKYSELLAQLNQEVYSVRTNPFNNNHAVNLLTSSIFLAFDSPLAVKEYLLAIEYDSQFHSLAISYHPELGFFSEVAAYVRHFMAKLSAFKDNKISFYEFMLFVPDRLNHLPLSQIFSTTGSIIELFEAQVRLYPQNIALVYREIQLTYTELNEQANQLANYLLTKATIKSDDLIVLCLDRSELQVIAILAVLKAGAAYVPIDPSMPEERIAFIIEDASPKLILTTKQEYARFKPASGYLSRVIMLDDANCLIELVQQPILAPTGVIVNSDNLAYVIYTSGTTGKPKGVLQPHANLIRLFSATADNFKFNAKDVWTLFHSYVFDFSVWELWGALIYGGKLVIPSTEQILDLEAFYELCQVQQVTVLNQTPGAFYRFSDIALAKPESDKLVALRYVIFGGEALNLALLQPWFEYYGYTQPQFVNMYGITETTVHVTYKLITPEIPTSSSLIGWEIADQRIYILDKNLQLLPVGVIGEMYVSGAGLARAYLNRRELTNEKFMANPFQTAEEKALNFNSRIYKTGDLGRRLTNFELEYIGRNDQQVKIRGYRIELGEIENMINSYPGIKQSVVLAREYLEADGASSNNKYLVAYYVASQEVTEADLLRHLTELVPVYMLPASFIQLDKIPLTINGKLDHKALPNRLVAITNLVLPRNDLEKELCVIWATILNRDLAEIGVTDDFFKLGGNSILAIKLVYYINRQLQKNLDIKTLYANRSIEKLAQLLKSGSFIYASFQIGSNKIINDYEPFQISNVQQAYLLGREPSNPLGGVSTHVYYEVLYKEIDKARLESAINKIIQRHKILHSQFANNLQQQILRQPCYYSVDYYCCQNNEQLLEVRQRFSHEVIPLSQVPLFNIVLSKLEYVDKFVVHFSFDALLLDVASIRIFLQELEIFYNQPNSELVPLEITFKDYRDQFVRICQSELYQRDKEYWLDKLDLYNFEISLPLAKSAFTVKKPHFARINKVIAWDIWHKVKSKANRYGISLTSLVLLVYGKTIAFWSGQENVCINLTLFNRLPLHEQVNRIMGDFTVLELFNFKQSRNCSLKQQAEQVHNDLWSDIQHSLYDSIDFIRHIRQAKQIPTDKIIAPIVLTSILGESIQWAPGLDSQKSTILYFTAQTPQVWIDNKAYETADGFIAEWDYVEELFSQETMSAIHGDYCRLIESLAELDWEKSGLAELNLPASDLAFIQSVNQGSQFCPEETLFGYFENLVEKQHLTNAIAIIDAASKTEFSYAKLIYDSQALAKYLFIEAQARGWINSDKFSRADRRNANLVAILCEKGYFQALATLAIMKSGQAYLPLNVEWPLGRIEEVLAQGGVRQLLISRQQATRTELQQRLANSHQLIIIEDLFAEQLALSDVQSVNLPQVAPDDIAYVIFTSGSTGTPKGVAISHRAALNTILAINCRFNLNPHDRILAISELSFDLSVYDLFGSFAAGACVVFPIQTQAKIPGHWLELVTEYQITVWNSVPQLAALLVDKAGAQANPLKSIRLYLVSGDWVPLSLPDKIHALNNYAQVVSLGGATEAAIWSNWYEVKQVEPDWKSIPYGRAMPNQTMYIMRLDEPQLAPVQVTGEICIGGLGLAVGYWGEEQKTRASFYLHPQLGRLYKTGDLGCLHPDGNIEFLGRKDDQVKLNGYRIELGEIAAKLNKLPGISDALVILQAESARNYLVGYLLPEDISIIKNQDEFDNLPKPALTELGQDLLQGKSLMVNLPESAFCLRKSYRKFSEQDPLSSELINSLLVKTQQQALRLMAQIAQAKNNLNWESLAQLLAPLAALQLKDKAAPKYLYPSAGGSYSIRCYLNLAKDLFELNPGYYYFNPKSMALAACEPLVGFDSECCSLDLICYWPAIKPFYPNEARKFAYLEIGHMCGILLRQLEKLGLRGRVEIVEEEINTDLSLLARIIVTEMNTSPNVIAHNSDNKLRFELNLQANFLAKVSESRYLSNDGMANYDLKQQSIFTQANAYAGGLLRAGQGLIILCDDESAANSSDSNLNSPALTSIAEIPAKLIQAGIWSQLICEDLITYDIGSCILGTPILTQGLTAMVLGKVAPEEKLTSNSQAQPVILREILNSQLADFLPEYMLPYDYILLERFPLTTNGKTDVSKLPRLKLAEKQANRLAARTAIEREVSKIFADLLQLDSNQIGIDEDFFRLGGNSLLAVQLVSVLNSTYTFNLGLLDFYKLRTIEQISLKLAAKPVPVTLKKRISL